MMNIFEVAQSGDTEQIKVLLTKDPHSLHQLDEMDRNVLMCAVLSGNLELVKYMHHQGADIHWVSPQFGNSVLGFAVSVNQKEIVDYLLKQGVDVDLYSISEEWPLSRDSQSPVSMACKYGNKEIVELLVNHSAKLSDGDLVNAVESGNIELVRFLLDTHKISANDTNEKNIFQMNALGMAVFKGDTQMACLLLAHGAHADVPESKNFLDQTHISSAVHHLAWITVESLILYGAKLNDLDIWQLARYNQWEILEFAVKKGCLLTTKTILPLTLHALDSQLSVRWLRTYSWSHSQLAECLIESCKRNRMDIVELIWSLVQDFSSEIQSKSVLAACESGSIELLKWILKVAKFPLLLESKLKESKQIPLHAAIMSAQYEMVQFLLELGATCVLSKDQVSPLVLACKANALEIAQLLLRYDADLHGVNQLNGSTYASPLHALCAYQGSDSAIKFLISQGAQIEVRDERQRRPLELAIEYGYEDRIRALIEAGSKIPSPKDQEYPIFFSALTQCFDAQITKYLIEETEHKQFLKHYDYTHFLLAAMNGDLKQIEDLSNAGEDIEQCNQWGQTALLLAAASGHKHVLQELIDQKAKLDHMDEFNFGAITWAGSANDQFEIVKLLLEAGSSPNLYDEFGSALTKLATRVAWKSVKCLLEFGANPRIETEWENSVMIEACLQGEFEMVQFLLQNPNPHPLYSYRARHPVEAALINNHWKIVDLLLHHSIWPFENYNIDLASEPTNLQTYRKNMKWSDLEFKHQLSNALRQAYQEKQTFWIAKWQKLFNNLKTK